jgi:lipopolysaccharide biosynthesis glycosyltransferase
MKSKLGIMFCVENGQLEVQTELLIKSIEYFLEESEVTLFACSPRKNHIPHDFRTKIFGLNIIHIDKDLNKKMTEYPIANKVICSNYVENHFPNIQNLIFVDSDTVFLNPLSQNLLAPSQKLYLRPVDNKGPGSGGSGGQNDDFWHNIFNLCGVNLPEPSIWTTVRPNLIRNYFNAGLIWVNGIPGFFQQWHDDFISIVNSDLRPFGYKSRDGDDFRCLDQVALAVTATRFQEYVQILPETYNYPIPFRPKMKDRVNHPKFNELVHIHYHKWFQHPGFLDHITTDEEKESEQYLWLQEQLPLQPVIGDQFKC